MSELNNSLKTLKKFKNLNEVLFKICNTLREKALKLDLNNNELMKSESNVLKYCKIISNDNKSETAIQTVKDDQIHKIMNKRTFKCVWPGCNQLFNFSANLVRHKRVHTGDKPYICEVNNCKKKLFTNISSQRTSNYYSFKSPKICLSFERM